MNAHFIPGDVLHGLATLPDQSVQTCITSPPYYGLRDYGTAQWEGGRKRCDHKPVVKPRAERPKNGLHSLGYTDACQQPCYRDVCRKCGARRVDHQIGLEETPEAYVQRMVEVFREVRRVLKDDGTLWLNLGDSYATGTSKQTGRRDEQPEYLNRRALQFGTGRAKATATPTTRTNRNYSLDGVKPKDLIGIPWMVAFALRADGWYLRQDLIWAKPNPMPESVRDRCTKAHEYLFLLSKSPRYLYQSDAVKEPCVSLDPRHSSFRPNSVMISSTGRKTYTAKHSESVRVYPKQGRNRRSVWTITPKPFKGAHFAVMPEALVEPCLLAGSQPGDLVLDPFAGSGTVAVVANRNGRHFVGTELNPEYIKLAQARVAQAVRIAA